MYTQPSSWKTLLTNLGFGGRRRRAGRKANYSRRLRFEWCEDRTMLAVITVNSLLDNGDGAKTTIREAIVQANQNPDLDTINFSTNPADGLNAGTIALTQGELTITQSVIINATMLSAGLTINAGGGTDHLVGNFDGHKIFNILGGSSGQVEINGLTLTGGDTVFGAGAISSATNLLVKNTVITGNAGGTSAHFALAV